MTEYIHRLTINFTLIISSYIKTCHSATNEMNQHWIFPQGGEQNNTDFHFLVLVSISSLSLSIPFFWFPFSPSPQSLSCFLAPLFFSLSSFAQLGEPNTLVGRASAQHARSPQFAKWPHAHRQRQVTRKTHTKKHTQKNEQCRDSEAIIDVKQKKNKRTNKWQNNKIMQIMPN